MTQQLKSVVVPLPGPRDIAAYGTVDANVPGAIGSMMENMKAALGAMQPDDILLEVDASSEAGRTTAHVRFRAYKHR
jgi:hypothetical protein